MDVEMIESTQQLVLYKGGAPVDLNEHPSLLALLHASNRAIVAIDDRLKAIDDEITELREREKLHEELGLPPRAIRATITRRESEIAELLNRREAHEANYLEVPVMQSQPLKMGRFGRARWAESLSADVPMDVLRALKHAKDAAIFDDFQIYTPQAGTDPVIVGMIGGHAFYIASW